MILAKRPEVDRFLARPTEGADAGIEFSTPQAAVANIALAAEAHVPVVVGTTGWLDQLDEAKKLIAQHEGAMVWSPNFSIGVNVFTHLAAEAARLAQSR